MLHASTYIKQKMWHIQARCLLVAVAQGDAIFTAACT